MIRNRLFAFALTVAGPVLPAPVAGQDCPAGRISYVFIDNHSVFDTSQIEDDRFEWAYDLANKLHFRTREQFIVSELLFAAGDCYDPFLLEESERLLREHRFIAQADVFALGQADGTHHVVVDTQDEWTTQLSLGVSFDDGIQVEKLSLTEKNLLGRGLILGAFFEERYEVREAGFTFETPRLFSSRWTARFVWADTRTGSLVEQGLAYPFVGEVGQLAARQGYSRQDLLFSYSTGQDGPFSHVALPMFEERIEATGALRLGEPGGLTLLGIGVSQHTRTFPGFPESLRVVAGGDFDNTSPAGAGEVAAVEEYAVDRRATRVNLLFGRRNLRFVRRRGLDSMTGIQDIPVGTEVGVTIGRSLGTLSQSAIEQPDDFYTQLSFLLGLSGSSWVLNSGLRLEARRVLADSPGEAGWRDILAEGDLFAYWQPKDRHTLFGRVSASGGWSMDAPFQLTLGGRDLVRGYDRAEFPGGRRVVLTLEDRIRLFWPAPSIVETGVTLFADAGRVVGAGIPYGGDSGWRASLGAGLRLGFPPGTRHVARLDLALPMGAGRGLGGLIFRAGVGERIGVMAGFDDEQMVRSRAVDVSTDFSRARR